MMAIAPPQRALWKRRLVPRWTKGVSGHAGDGAESYSKEYERYRRIIKLTVERNGE
jgi:hypothetical protein